MKRLTATLALAVCLSGCANYLSTNMRQSALDRIYQAQRQVQQSNEELAKLYGYAYSDSWNWAADAAVAQSWAQGDLQDTRNNLDENKRNAQKFLQKLEESNRLLDTVRRDLGGQ